MKILKPDTSDPHLVGKADLQACKTLEVFVHGCQTFKKSSILSSRISSSNA